MEILKNTEDNQRSVRKRLIYIISLILCITAILIGSFILIFSNNRNAEAAPSNVRIPTCAFKKLK